jgi:GH35 family endo-1,4-beta-xylanase
VPAYSATDRIPDGGKLITPKNALKQYKAKPSNNPDRLTHRWVAAQHEAFDRAVQVTTKVRPDKPYTLSVMFPIKGAIDKTHTYLLDFWVRCPNTTDEAGVGRFDYMIEKNKVDWQKVVKKPGTAQSQWKHIFMPFQPRHTLKKGNAHFVIHLGKTFPQRLRFAQVRLWDYGRGVDPLSLPMTDHTYPGRSEDAPWRERAKERIEKHRKAPLQVQVEDESGQPVPNADVHVHMQQHRFKFGTAITAIMTGWKREQFPYKVQPRISGGFTKWTWPQARQYRRILADNFNSVVFEGAFRPWVYGNNDRRRKAMFASLPWLDSHDMTVRGHFLSLGLIRHRREKKWGDRPDAYKQKIFDYIDRVVPELGDRIDEWDVIGHPVNGDPDLPDLVDDPDIHTKIMRRTRKLAPESTDLFVVEGGVLAGGANADDYYAFLKKLKRDGQAPDGIGFMTHFESGGLKPLPELYQSMERFAPFAEKLQFTELDVNAPGDPQLQADYMRDLMIIGFSHPKMSGIVHWGFWTGRHWKPTAAMWKNNFSPKPAAKMYRELVFDRWWTDVKGQTNDRGMYQTRGFLGDYQVRIRHNGDVTIKRLTLKEDGAKATVTVEQ